MFNSGFWKAAGLGVMLVLNLPSAASAGLLGLTGEYGEFVFGSSSRRNMSSQGPVAVGGSERGDGAESGGRRLAVVVEDVAPGDGAGTRPGLVGSGF